MGETVGRLELLVLPSLLPVPPVFLVLELGLALGGISNGICLFQFCTALATW